MWVDKGSVEFGGEGVESFGREKARGERGTEKAVKEVFTVEG